MSTEVRPRRDVKLPDTQVPRRDPRTREWVFMVFKDGSIIHDENGTRKAGRYKWGRVVRVDGRSRYRRALAIAKSRR